MGVLSVISGVVQGGGGGGSAAEGLIPHVLLLVVIGSKVRNVAFLIPNVLQNETV